jgi:hypothetical protein
MRPKFVLYLVLLLILALTLSACAPASQPAPTADSMAPATADPNEGAPADESGPLEGDAVATEPPAGESQPVAADDSPLGRVPANVPIMDGAYDTKVSGSGLQITYKVSGSVNEVVEFYQIRLADLGWESAGPPDTAVGATALMLRKNAEDNRLSINLQYNPTGLFTVVSLVVTR